MTIPSNKLMFTKGDTHKFKVSVYNKVGGVRTTPNLTGATVVLSAKPPTTAGIVVTLTGVVDGVSTNVVHFQFNPADTALMALGTYEYDVQVTTVAPDEDVYTVVKSTLTLLAGITP